MTNYNSHRQAEACTAHSRKYLRNIFVSCSDGAQHIFFGAHRGWFVFLFYITPPYFSIPISQLPHSHRESPGWGREQVGDVHIAVAQVAMFRLSGQLRWCRAYIKESASFSMLVCVLRRADGSEQEVQGAEVAHGVETGGEIVHHV